MKNILLVNPWIYDFAAYDFWIAPLGLLYIASFLRKNGYDIRIIDCLSPLPPDSNRSVKKPRRFDSGHGKFLKEPIEKPHALHGIERQYSRYGMPIDAFQMALKDIPRPDMICVTSMMTYWYPAVFDAIRILKEAFPESPVILGGTYATLCPDHASRSGADVIVSGEGEARLPELLKQILGDDSVFVPDFRDLDSYPYPAFDLMARREQISLLTSRGCPFRCGYCASHLLNDVFRRRNPFKVADEIEYWHKSFGIKHFSFYDDALLVNSHELAIPLFTEIIRRGLKCRFHCPNGLHLREITPELSRLMFRAGVQTLRFGFETSDSAKQKETGGKVNNENLRHAIAFLAEAGYRPRDIGIYLLCGMPGQTAAEVRESISFVSKCGAKPLIAEYSPIPGTALWRDAVKESPDPISDEPLFQNNSLLPCRSQNLSYEMYRHCKMLTRIA
jgi:radical SAM superfamily enzyme YgiQ (UPF0313 family)